MATSCVRIAEASGEAGQDTVPAPVLAPSEEALGEEVSLVPALPLEQGGVAHGTLRWAFDDGGGDFSFETELVAELSFTRLQPVHAEDLLDVEASRAYSVAGSLRHNSEATSCDAGETRCRVISLVDADLVGIAIRRGGVLSVELDWRSFGPESASARPEAIVALGWDQIGYLGVADSLEASGVVGTTVVVDLASGRVRQVHWARGSASGTGVLEVSLG